MHRVKRRGSTKSAQCRRSIKKIAFFTILILLCNICAFAQDEQGEKKAAVGLGAEFNMNSRYNFAGGAVLGFDFNLSRALAAGFTVTYSSNFSGISVIEPAALFRWYIFGGGAGLFVQADAGAYLVLEDGELTPLFMGGLRGGFRLPLGELFFIEPYGRGGYPFVFGVGVIAGTRF